jgi:enamine deaminase RidA (YjgF/YER057c/UK114 family)
MRLRYYRVHRSATNQAANARADDPPTGAPHPIGTYSQAVRAGSTVYAVKVTIFLTDMGHFARVNEAMARHVHQPYPARAAVGVASLPRGAVVEVEAVLVLEA